MKVVVMVEMKVVVKVVMKVILAEKILILASNTFLQKSISEPILTTIFICATLITIPSPPPSSPSSQPP